MTTVEFNSNGLLAKEKNFTIIASKPTLNEDEELQRKIALKLKSLQKKESKRLFSENSPFRLIGENVAEPLMDAKSDIGKEIEKGGKEAEKAGKDVAKKVDNAASNTKKDFHPKVAEAREKTKEVVDELVSVKHTPQPNEDQERKKKKIMQIILYVLLAAYLAFALVYFLGALFVGGKKAKQHLEKKEKRSMK